MKWLKRIRSAIGMGLLWAVAWAGFGLLIGVSSLLLPWLPWDSFFRVFDAPLPALALPGFIGGVIFSLVLAVAEQRRAFDDLSITRFGRWGALGGLLLSLVPVTMVSLGLGSTEGATLGIWQFTAIISPALTALSAASAAGTLAIARRSKALPRAEHIDALMTADHPTDVAPPRR